MTRLSNDQVARSRKMQSRILQAIEANGQKNVAHYLGVDASTICRMKSAQGSAKCSEIENVCNLLAALGLKIVPREYKMLRDDVLQSMLVINQEFYRRVGSVDDLAHDEMARRDDLDY